MATRTITSIGRSVGNTATQMVLKSTTDEAKELAKTNMANNLKKMKEEDPEGYAKTRENITWGYGLVSGFLPINPVIWPMQITMFIFFVIILMAIGVGFGNSLLVGYLLQGFATAYIMYKGADYTLNTFFGL